MFFPQVNTGAWITYVVAWISVFEAIGLLAVIFGNIKPSDDIAIIRNKRQDKAPGSINLIYYASKVL